MKTKKQSQHYEVEKSWYDDFYHATEQFFAKGELAEILEDEFEFYDLKKSNPTTERNTKNACVVLILWICLMRECGIDRYVRDDYFGLFEWCYDISKDNTKLPVYPFYVKEAKSMTKEEEMAAINYINKFVYGDGGNTSAFYRCHTMIDSELKEIINGHSLLDIYKGLTKYANETSNFLYSCISDPSKELLIALGRDAHCNIDFQKNDAFTKILASKPKWKKMIESMRDDNDHLMVLGRLVWKRRKAYHSDYEQEIAIHYWIYVCNKEEMHQLDDEFGYVAEKKEKKKTIVFKQDWEKFERARNIWEEFVKKGYLEREGKMYRWIGNNSQFGYFIHYAHKYLHKSGTKEDRIDWGLCCMLFSMPQSAKKTYTTACSTINTFEKNKRNNSKKSQQLTYEAQKISKIFKYIKRPK